ncbi:MAG: hypothetical protein AMXMBFR84_01600 [Candidatus Hydrogenedentota bacterium]
MDTRYRSTAIALFLTFVAMSCSSLPSVPSVGGGGEWKDGKYRQSGVKYVPLNQFHDACAGGNIFAVNKMLEDNPKIVNQHDDQFGESPLGWAVRGKAYQVIRVLLDSGAKFESRNFDGMTPLTIALAQGRSDLFMLLVNNGADINYPDGHERTALHWAVAKGLGKVVQYLVERDAKINVRDEDGLTPLDWAVNNRYTDLADYLKGAGAKPGEPVKKPEEEPAAAETPAEIPEDTAPAAPDAQGGK